MSLQGTLLLYQLFLQQATAAYNTVNPWDSLEWKITLNRLQQDAFTIKILRDRYSKQREITTIPGATCNDEKWTNKISKRSGEDKKGMTIHCTCNLNSSTFVSKLKSCVGNIDLKKGCQFTTGSWSWNGGWQWDLAEDALIVLNNTKRSHGITIGLNATTTEYHSCSVVSLSSWSEDLKWTYVPLDGASKPVMFKLRNTWHFSWNIKEMKQKIKRNMTGKIMKVFIECEKTVPPQNEDEEFAIKSCWVFKVSGKLNFFSNNWDQLQNNTLDIRVMTSKTREKQSILVSLLVPLSIGLFIFIVLFVVCYTRRTCCFAQSENLHHTTVVDDSVVQTKLISSPENESSV